METYQIYQVSWLQECIASARHCPMLATWQQSCWEKSHRTWEILGEFWSETINIIQRIGDVNTGVNDFAIAFWMVIESLGRIECFYTIYTCFYTSMFVVLSCPAWFLTYIPNHSDMFQSFSSYAFALSCRSLLKRLHSMSQLQRWLESQVPSACNVSNDISSYQRLQKDTKNMIL